MDQIEKHINFERQVLLDNKNGALQVFIRNDKSVIITVTNSSAFDLVNIARAGKPTAAFLI